MVVATPIKFEPEGSCASIPILNQDLAFSNGHLDFSSHIPGSQQFKLLSTAR